MVVHELRKTLEKRRFDLILVLENPNSVLELSKKHQIYGAIKEIENVLRTIEHLRDNEFAKETFELSNEPEPKFLDRLSTLLKR